MARGRRPKPVELKEAEDNPGRRPLPEPIKTAPMELVDPPGVLGAAGAELWSQVVEQLGAIGALASLDRIALLTTCLQWDDFMLHRKVLEQQGHYAKGSMGQLVEHPALKAQARAAALLLRGMGDFAATPVARARLATAKQQEKQVDEFEEITGELVEDGEIDGELL